MSSGIEASACARKILSTSSLIKLRPSPKLAITISDSFVVSVITSIIHSKLDYCNSLYYNLSLPKSQITRLQPIQNSLARVVVKTPKCCHITPILHSSLAQNNRTH